MPGQNFTKQDIVNSLNLENQMKMFGILLIIMLLWVLPFYIIYTLIDALMLSVLGFLTSKMTKLKIKYSAIYTMAIYSLTLPILLNLIYMIVNILTGFTIEYFNFLYTSVSGIIMVTAILMIRADLIKKQAELMKIISEQEKIRAELDEQRRREEEELERRELEKKDKEQEEKEKSEEPSSDKPKQKKQPTPKPAEGEA